MLALQDLSFQVWAGELFGDVGSNGAGKTATMRLAIGVLAADAGEVRWAGVPLTFAARRRSGYMPEERGLSPKMRVRRGCARCGSWSQGAAPRWCCAALATGPVRAVRRDVPRLSDLFRHVVTETGER